MQGANRHPTLVHLRKTRSVRSCEKQTHNFLLVSLLWLAVMTASGATFSWSGDGSTGNWSEPANWGFAGVPATGDTIVFPAAKPRLTNTNNLSGLTLVQVRFAGAGGGYTIYGNAFTVTQSIHATNTAGVNTINNDISLSGREATVNVGTGTSLYLAGVLSGDAGLTKEGAGTLRVSGPNSNTYGGVTLVNAGVLQLQKGIVSPAIAIPGSLVIGDGVTSATVRHLAGMQIDDSSLVTVHAQGVLDLNGFLDTIAALTLVGGTAQSGSGTLTLNGDLTSQAATIPASVTGKLRFLGGQRRVSAQDGSAFYDLDLYAAISDAGGGLLFTNPGATGDPWVRLLGSNSFTGPVVVENLTADVEAPWGLGATNGDTTIGSQGCLWLYGTGITNEALTIEAGAVLVAQNNCHWVGPVTLNGPCNIEHYGFSSVFQISGTVSGPGGFTKERPGTVRLTGSAMNTYLGDTWVKEGTLELGKANAVRYGRLVIGDGLGGNGVDVVREMVDEGIYGGSGGVTVVVGSSGLLDLDNHTDYVGPIEMESGWISTGPSGLLNLAPPLTSYGTNPTNGNAMISGRMQVSVPSMLVISNGLELHATVSGSGSLTKAGFGYLFLLNSNSFSGLTVVQDGILWAYSAWALGTTENGTVVSNGASLVLLGNFGVTNESLSLNGPGENAGYGALGSQTAGTNLWVGPITLDAPDCTLSPYFTNTVIRIIGQISGPGGFTQFGSGKLYLEGASPNTFGGAAWLREGSLLLSKTGSPAISGSGFTIGDGAGAENTALVRELLGFQIASIPVTLNNDGLLDLNGFEDTIGQELFLNGGDVQTGDGILHLSGANHVQWNAKGSHLYGHLNIGSSTSTWSGPALNTLYCYASIRGSAMMLKTNTAYLDLQGSNTFSGPLRIEGGLVYASHTHALGQTNSGTTVVAPGRLGISVSGTIQNEALWLIGPDTISTLFGRGASNTLTGPIELTNRVLIGVSPETAMNLAGPISGPGALGKIHEGTLILSGALPNTYSGDTWVYAGSLVLQKSVNNGAIQGNLFIGDGVGGEGVDLVQLIGNPQIGGNGNVAIASSGLLDIQGLAGPNEAIGSFSGAGRVELGSKRLNTGGNNGSSMFTGQIIGVGGQISKEGTGTFTLGGPNLYTGLTTISQGILIVEGFQPGSPVSVTSQGTLAGGGTVGPITVAGKVSPGASPGRISSGNAAFSPSGRLVIELRGMIGGLEHDQLFVTGTVALTNAALELVADFDPNANIVAGRAFHLILNDGADPVIGTFNGLPNRSQIALNDYRFQIDYDGGDGNDVVLTVVETPARALSGSIAGGNGNHILDPNECNHLKLVLTNNTATPMTGITTKLWSTNEEVLVTQTGSSYPDIPVGGRATNTTLFQIATLPRLTCGPDVQLMLSVYTASHGTFATPLTLPSGGALSPSLAYTNSVAMALADGNSITSTIPVSGFPGHIGKAVVSLFLTHSQDWDLEMWLIAPDGTSVELTSNNGLTGMNYGLACNPFENRTVFDDSAATPITAGVAPFVGLHRPESPLAVLRGRTGPDVNGDWRLVVRDWNANGHTGSLVCWYLNLYPVTGIDGGGMCDTCPGTFQGAIASNDPFMTNHLQTTPLQSSRCGQHKPCPPVQAGPVRYDTWSFSNDGPPACVTVMIDTYGNPVQVSAYLGAFNTNDLCMNYLGDAGDPAPPAQRFSFEVPGNTNFVVVVNDMGAGCTNYTLYVMGTPCPTPTLAIEHSQVPNRTRLHWPTWAAGFGLETRPGLALGFWQPWGIEPVVVNGRFTITNSSAWPSQFFRLHKPQ